MRKLRLVTSVIAMCTMVLSLCSCQTHKDSGKSNLDPDNPVTVTVWNYYNGDQLTAFESLVEEFNSTVGIDKGITVVSVSQGDINTLADSLIDSVNEKAGAQECPELAAVYAETAYILDETDALSSFDQYFTEDELSEYVPEFIDEGRFNEANELLLFPILKSTEVFTANATDWEPFSEATGITLEGLKTKEDLTAAAKAYYEWTDAQTPEVLEDGKALYGRDSVANYVYNGAYQLGHDMFKVDNGKLTIDMDRDTFKTLWDNFYIPYINGYFGSYAKFRSEDCKTGKILALTSSSSSVGYLPTAVTLEDDSTHDINIYETSELVFENAKVNSVVQQGASYCLLKSTPAQEEGAVEFVKWFTDSERNMKFAVQSGYSPVTLKANSKDAVEQAYTGDTSTAKGKNILDALLISAEAFTGGEAYATKPFNGSKDVRALLGDALENAAITDRAAVVEAIEGGASREEATAQYSTDEYFDKWFNDVCTQVKALTE